MSNPILTQTRLNDNRITAETSFPCFESWDQIDAHLTKTTARPFDITGWRFADSAYWFDELCFVPMGAGIVVRWAADPEPQAKPKRRITDPALIAEFRDLERLIGLNGGGTK